MWNTLLTPGIFVQEFSTKAREIGFQTQMPRKKTTPRKKWRKKWRKRANRTKLIGVLATALVGSFFWIHPWSLKIGIMRTVGSVIALYHFFQYLRFFGRYYLPMNSSSVPLQKRCRTCLWTWLTQVHTTECFFWPIIMRDCLPLLISHESFSISIEAGLSMPKGCSNLQWPFWSWVDWVVLTNTTHIEHGTSWDQEITKGFEDDSPKMEAWLWHAMATFLTVKVTPNKA